jgi:hypothetical protein
VLGHLARTGLRAFFSACSSMTGGRLAMPNVQKGVQSLFTLSAVRR